MKKENNKKTKIPEGYIDGKDFVTFVQMEQFVGRTKGGDFEFELLSVMSLPKLLEKYLEKKEHMWHMFLELCYVKKK